ncbi:DUF4145 domain-containing protein [Pararhizobium sp.]|uniref:DUF4145 domain-containing protein n=1 Tax=Pararhizobium sp. TaxID=1977563 RepID=UPI002719B6BE|nr:DUF4145 domain-containing protein [Pararhizobium sp.]MDO9417971.1 DUF4145 domain-containing protein [Pararhizobium sp.]
MDNKYEAPSYGSTGFNCPHCGVRAVQRWARLSARYLGKGKAPPVFTNADLEKWRAKEKNPDLKLDPASVLDLIQRTMSGEVFLDQEENSRYGHELNNLFSVTCEHCGNVSIWLAGNMIYPLTGDILPHDDLPNDIKRTFSEASKITDISPRASAALSRLVIQELCVFLKTQSKDLNEQIGELVKSGLNPDVQLMLDAVRVIGNNAVHPGIIDLRDDQETARFLLNCINRICQRMITEKLEAEKLFEQLPAGAKAAIERRDKQGHNVIDS